MATLHNLKPEKVIKAFERAGWVIGYQKDRNLKLKRRDIELKAERLRLREELLKFKRDRFESWKNLMEDKRKQ